jgi:hypothetical protein
MIFLIIRLQTSNISTYRGNSWETIWQYDQNRIFDKVGIFWSKNEKDLNIALFNFPINQSFLAEFEILGYIRRSFGPMQLVELYVEREEQFNTLTYQLNEFVKNIHYSKKTNEPYYYEILKKFRNFINDFLQESQSLISRIESEMMLKEVEAINIELIRKKISTIKSIASNRQLPNQFDFIVYLQKLTNLEKQFDINVLKEKVNQRELNNFTKIHQKLYDEYVKDKSNFLLADFEDSISNVKEKLDNFNTFTQKITQRRSPPSNLNQTINQINNNFNNLIQQMEREKQDLLKKEEKIRKMYQLEEKILTQLKAFTPGVQTLLNRISDLTGLDNKVVEDIIKKLLDKNPELGTYDELSQVFIPGQNISRDIDALLAKFNSIKD